MNYGRRQLDLTGSWLARRARSLDRDRRASVILAPHVQRAANQAHQRAMREQPALRAATCGKQRRRRRAATSGVCGAVGTHANTIIAHNRRDPPLVRAQLHLKRQRAVQRLATRVLAGVADRLERRPQQQIGHNRRQRVGGGARIIGQAQAHGVERATELALQRGAQRADETLFQAPQVRHRRGAHQARRGHGAPDPARAASPPCLFLSPQAALHRAQRMRRPPAPRSQQAQRQEDTRPQ